MCIHFTRLNMYDHIHVYTFCAWVHMYMCLYVYMCTCLYCMCIVHSHTCVINSHKCDTCTHVCTYPACNQIHTECTKTNTRVQIQFVHTYTQADTTVFTHIHTHAYFPAVPRGSPRGYLEGAGRQKVPTVIRESGAGQGLGEEQPAPTPTLTVSLQMTAMSSHPSGRPLSTPHPPPTSPRAWMPMTWSRCTSCSGSSLWKGMGALSPMYSYKQMRES